MIQPEMISEAVEPLIRNQNVYITNLIGKIKNNIEFKDKNCIKVVCDNKSDALYFSRAPIPFNTTKNSYPMGKQICVIPFRRDFLIEYNNLKPTPLEIAESIDMIRVLEHGMKVRMVPTDYDTFAVDTKKDLEKVEKIMIRSK